ncbi:hypothetical protein PR048_032914 [Dryococelus australis]|uniref:Uncharacterized protein n=1 Tax=Dryococelus australis TaxID=614101 RepID=A0ABQ9G3K2_9NEOP|nr:hypothetical protein PR048_032914 [Dryococelus australis]
MLDSELFSPAENFLDQVIEVDNLTTKILKVLRIIQLENDACIEEQHDERLQLSEQEQHWENIGVRLRTELKEAKQQLQQGVHELQDTRVQL